MSLTVFAWHLSGQVYCVKKWKCIRSSPLSPLSRLCHAKKKNYIYKKAIKSWFLNVVSLIILSIRQRKNESTITIMTMCNCIQEFSFTGLQGFCFVLDEEWPNLINCEPLFHRATNLQNSAVYRYMPYTHHPDPLKRELHHYNIDSHCKNGRRENAGYPKEEVPTFGTAACFAARSNVTELSLSSIALAPPPEFT